MCFALLAISCSKDNGVGERPGYLDEEEQLDSLTGLASVRERYQGNDVTLGAIPVKAVVISQSDQGNIEDGLLAIQEANSYAAILLEIPQNTTYSFGDELSLDLNGAILTSANGELLIKGLSADKIEVVREDVAIVPRILSTSEVKRRAKQWGPILVCIQKSEIEGEVEGKYNGKLFFKDAIDSVASKIMTSATFFNKLYPEYAKSITGIVRLSGSEVFVNIRNEADVVAGIKDEDPGNPTNPVVILEQFEGLTKGNYNKEDLVYPTGIWTLDDAMIGVTGSDPKNGAASIRMRGALTMNFDYKGLKEIAVSYGIYPAAAETGSPNPTTIDVEMSTDGGVTYTFLKQIVINTELRILSTTAIPLTVNPQLPVRFRIVNSSQTLSTGNKPRINIDDFLFKF